MAEQLEKELDAKLTDSDVVLARRVALMDVQIMVNAMKPSKDIYKLAHIERFEV